MQDSETKITMLEQKLRELSAENKMLRNRLRSKSTEDSTRHKSSHIHEPESVNFNFETDLIDEQTSNVPSISPVSLLDDDEMDESSNDESPVVSVSDASNEVELRNELMETNETPQPTRPTLKRKKIRTSHFFEFIHISLCAVKKFNFSI